MACDEVFSQPYGMLSRCIKHTRSWNGSAVRRYGADILFFHLTVQVDLCDKSATEKVFDLHRYATKMVLFKVILRGTRKFPFLRMDVQI